MKSYQNKKLITGHDFLISAKSDYCVSGDLNSTLKWIEKIKFKVNAKVNKIDLLPLKKWYFDNEKGLIRHDSGGFYSIEGIRVDSNIGPLYSWDQPIINQNEIGYLGFLVKKFNGVLHFLAQAKIEPGNVNIVQISPTLQATKSNCLTLHKGNLPSYLSFFNKPENENIIVDNLHSELGSKFLKKRNRNLIVFTNKEIKILENFKWITLKQLKHLAILDNMLNIDTRSVMATINFNLNLNDQETKNHFAKNAFENYESEFLNSIINEKNDHIDLNSIVNRITREKFNTFINIKKIKLNQMRDWEISEKLIKHKNELYFKVIGVEAAISNRENLNWQQPMIESYSNGIYACFSRSIKGKIHILVQIKAECANYDLVELAPALQLDSLEDKKTAFEKILLDIINNSNSNNFIFDTKQSEEGGRFFHIENRHILIRLEKKEDILLFENIPENYLWITLNQLTKLNRFDQILNIQLRSIIAMIPL